MEETKMIALLIDADNAPASKIDTVLSELAKLGTVNIRKAYGNWKSPSLKSWEENLHEYAIQPIQQFDLTKGKNATDMALAIDVMDILYTKKVDVFCLVSSDCDFTPLVTRILSDGKVVIGFGERKAPKAFVNSCSKFLFLDSAELSDIKEPKTVVSTLKGDSRLINLLRQAIDVAANDDGWAPLGPVGQHISNQTSFDQRNYGFKKLSDLFAAIDLFEVKKINKTIFVRDKKKATK